MKAGSSIEMKKYDDYKKAKLRLYQHLIGKLIHLSYETHINIAFVLCQLNKHNVNPWLRYMCMIEKVFCYLKRSAHLGLIYNPRTISQVYKSLKTTALFILIVYTNSNIAGNLEDCKSAIGYYFFIREIFIFWLSKK